MIEKTDIGDLKGIGEKTKKLFEKINVYTVGDLIRYYPHGYDVYEEAVPISELEEDKIQTVTGAIYGRVQVSGSSRMQVTTLHVKDLTGTLKVIWFRMPFLRNTLSGGGVITLRGRVLPIGGLKEKLLAAKSAGVKTVLVPEKNMRDVEEISSEITRGLEIIPVSYMDEVLKTALIYEENENEN